MFLVNIKNTPPTAVNRADVIELFDAIGILHGERFDDGRRWCGGCNTPMSVLSCDTAGPIGKVCGQCNSIWPEHMDEFAEMLLDPDSEDDILEMMDYTLN